MADSTRLVIELEILLRQFNRRLRELNQIEQKLKSIANIRVNQRSSTAPADRQTAAAQRLAFQQQRLQLQQQRLAVQTQELANRQERARQISERLAQSQQRLTITQQRLDQSQQRVARSAGQQADAHVKAFRAISRGVVDTNAHVRAFRASEDVLRRAPQLDAHVKAFRAIQRGAQDADAHVRAFRANQATLAKAPQMDAHVRAFRALEDATRRATQEQERARKSILSLDQIAGRVGGSLRNLGLGLTSLGSSLTVALTVPLTALGVLSARNAVTLDSLNRGLTAIVGSADEAGRQLSRLTQIAKLPGIGFQEAIQGSIRLQAVGFSAGVAERALIQFSNAVALTGGGREELARITVQLGQLSAKGKVLAQDLKPIIEAGPAVGRALLQAFGTVNSEDIQALGLSSQQFIDTLLNQLEKLPRAAAGLRNTFDNFSDAVFRASAAIGGAILPVLTRLIEVAEPIITRLAEGFRSLPAPVQTLVVAFAALGAAAGPTLFILGQFATGIGGLISALGRLHALGLLPTIAGFRLLQQVMAGTASLAAGQAATTAAAAGGWIALGGAVTVAAGVLAVATLAIISYVNAQRDAVKISKEQIAATDAQINTLKDQLEFTNSLAEGVERTADQQDRLAQIYADLNANAKIRLTAITDEEKRLAALREELQRLLNLRNEERIQQAASLAASLTETTAQIQANQKSRDSITDRIKANTLLAQAIEETGRVTAGGSRQLERLGLSGTATATQAIHDLRKANIRLIEKQDELIKSSEDLNGTAEEQATALRILQQQTGLSARELLSAAKAMGVFKGNIEETLPTIEKFIKTQNEAADANERFNKSLSKGGDDLLKAGDRAEAGAKRRREIIAAAASVARETSVDLAGAAKSLRQQVDAVVELRDALRRESEITGKSIDQILNEALTKGLDKGGTQLRNVREQLASQIQQIAEAQAEKELAIQKAANEAALDDNELSFAKQLTAYRQYLEERARLTDEQLAKEARAQLEIARNARAAQQRLLTAALSTRIPETERIKRRTQAGVQEEQALQAETKAAEIEAQRARNAAELKRALAETTIQQIKDIRQLDIEFAELQGSIEAALDARTSERFREELQQLARAQKFLSAEFAKAVKESNKDRQTEIESALKLNQSQIDLIELITQQELATNKLAAAQEFVRRAKERQSDLETELTFEVEFRGLKEEEAIRRRLEGERKLADSLRIVRDLIQDQVNLLSAQGVKPPQALLDFVRDINTEIRTLGELPFSEQFRLVEKEFNRLNEERLQKIEDIERAVRERDIAEAEGLLIIRRINGQYSADLEEQVRLLKEIAAASNDASLQRQAQSAEQTVKDANEQLAGFGRQLRSTGIDALQTGVTDFLASVGDRARTAKEKLLDLVDSVVARINQVIAENLSQKLIESIFGGGDADSGIIAAVGRLFGLGGGKGATGGVGGVAAGGITQTAEATAATTALTTGATAAATALTSGGVTAGAALVTSMTAAAASFSASIIAAGAAFAASVVGASAAQGVGGLGSAIGGAATGLFPSVPGGLVRIVEGGYPEAVLTTDPKHAARQVAILKAFLKETRGLGGRIRGLAAGGFTDRIDIAAPKVSLMSTGLGELAIAGTPSTMKQRFVFVDQRNFRDWAMSAEGEQVFVEQLYKHQPVVRKIGGGK